MPGSTHGSDIHDAGWGAPTGRTGIACGRRGGGGSAGPDSPAARGATRGVADRQVPARRWPPRARKASSGRRPSNMQPAAPSLAREPPMVADAARTPRAGLASAVEEPVRRSQATVWRRFRRHRLAMIGAAILLLLAVSAIAAPVISRTSPYSIDLSAYQQGPSAAHWLGTDSAGRDVFSRLLYAGRVSLTVGLTSVAIYSAIGVLLGAIAGFY